MASPALLNTTGTNQNITRMECKENLLLDYDVEDFDQNITRMECKEVEGFKLFDTTEELEYNQNGM